MHGTGTPLIGEGGQQVQGTVMRLEQHFGYAGSAAKIAIDLEGRMCIEQVAWRHLRLHL